ncbi:hypothetical protein FOZG_08133 [Fusarium oxysporum Fo47]|uniref:Uncharacterized protein n=1 Tax=Fusarium oxysporum Fo47 TaxID=660027 RepID=W9K3B4_FUSOX|nr:hypothetical protein FOZG_08133 [Fusarium oxysporum Fo47]
MAKSCTPPSNTTSGEATTIVDPLVDNNGPKQHANKVRRCPCVCE